MTDRASELVETPLSGDVIELADIIVQAWESAGTRHDEYHSIQHALIAARAIAAALASKGGEHGR